MNRRQVLWLTAMAVLTVLVTVSAPAFPQSEGAEDAAPDTSPVTGTDAIETILNEQEEVLSGAHFSYEPHGRRDPFRSLLTPTGGEGEKRPPGVAGMGVAELDLAGVVRDKDDGDVAMVIGSDNKGYFLRVGDKVFDATVLAVDPRTGSITFRQKVDDERLIKPYRDVVQRLVPLDDEESSDE